MGLIRISKLVRSSLVRISFVRVSLGFFAAHLMLGAFALAQVEAQAAATATVPRLIRINGSLHDDAGKPLTGNLGLTFTLYQDETSQSAVWQEVQTLPLDSAGHFSALLGAASDSGLPLEIFSAAEARWLGIRADGQTEQPRILLLSVAYALKAADTELLGGKPASAYVLADSQNAPAQSASGTNTGPANPQSAAQILTSGAGGILLSPTPQTACSGLSSDGTATVNQIAKFTSACNIENSAIFESGGSVGIGNTAPAGTLDVSGTAFVRGALTLPPVNTATTSVGYDSNPLVMEASSYNTILSRAVPYIWEWQAEPVGNDTSATSATLNLLFGVTGDVTETGLSVNQNGTINFASGQTFPGQGTGTVTSVATGAGLTGGTITKTGTISIPSAGVTNSMLANPSVTITAGSGLSGGGTVSLGGTVTLSNASPSSGGTVTSVASGTGLSGGPITGSGTLSLNTSYTNGLYLQLAGGTLTGALSGTTAAFSGGLTAATGAFTGTVTEAGILLPGTGTATATQGYNSNPLDLQASSFSSSTSKAITQDFRWQAQPTGNDTSTPSGSLNLLFGSNGTAPAATGFSIASTGLVTFATGQTFPGAGGSGTVTSVASGAGLTGGPITGSGTISIPSAGVTNAMLANDSITVTAGSGLSGGGTVALGGTVTLTNTAPGSGGTVTSVASGTGLSGGPITGSGMLSLNTSYTDARYLQLAGGTLTGGLTGMTAAFTSGTFSGPLSAAGALLPGTGTATATQGYNSNPLDLQASSFSSSTSLAITQDFRWMAESTGNDSSTPSGSLNLLFGSNGSSPAETGLSIASNGLITFAPGQTFGGGGGGGGSGTVTSVATGAGLTGGPITSNGSISIPSAGVTNAMLANNSITVAAGSGLSGGGTVALGGTVTLTNTSPSSGGTVTSVATGTGLTGGPITSSGTLSLNTTFTDKRYLQLAGGTLTGALTGTTGAFTGGLAATTGTFTGTVSEAGALLPGTGTATATQGFNSNPLDLQASAFSSTTSSAVTQDFRWMVEPTGNDTSAPSGSLNLLFGSNGSTPTATGLSIASNGLITFAPGQTFSGGTGGGSGTVTTLNTGPGLTGGPITTSGTISIPSAGVSNNMLANPSITITAGSGLSGGGTVALGGTVMLASNLAGTTDGIAYFSNPTGVVSTAAPTNGQLLIGSTGNAPVLSTLTAGENINITNSPGSVTISATGGSAVTLPFFVTGGEHTGGVQAATKNLTKLWGILLPYNITTTEITYDVTTADNTANIYDIGIFNNSGNLVADIGPTAGTTFAPSKAFRTSAWSQGSTSLAAGRYYLAFTTNCASTCAAIAASTTYLSFAINASAGASTGGALPSTITPPADVWGTGNQPTIVIH